MDPKPLYRRRMKLRNALAHVAKVLFDNGEHGVPPDESTGKVAAEVVRKLIRFALSAGVPLKDLLDPPGEPDSCSRIAVLLQARLDERLRKRKPRRRR